MLYKSAKRKVLMCLALLMYLQGLAHTYNEDLAELHDIQNIVINAAKNISKVAELVIYILSQENTRLTNIETNLQNISNCACNEDLTELHNVLDIVANATSNIQQIETSLQNINNCACNISDVDKWPYAGALALIIIQTITCIIFVLQLCLGMIGCTCLRFDLRSTDASSKIITVLASVCINGFFLPWYTWRFMKDSRYGPSFNIYADQFAILQNVFSAFIWIASAIVTGRKGNNIVKSTWTPIATSFITSAGTLIAIVMVPTSDRENSITSGLLTTALVAISTSLLTMAAATSPLGLN